jgi:hypothetical protein
MVRERFPQRKVVILAGFLIRSAVQTEGPTGCRGSRRKQAVEETWPRHHRVC